MTKVVDAEAIEQENAQSTASLIQRFATCLPRVRFIYFVVKTSASWQRARHLKGTSQSRSQIRSFVGRAIKIRIRRRRERFLSRGGDVALHRESGELFERSQRFHERGWLAEALFNLHSYHSKLRSGRSECGYCQRKTSSKMIQRNNIGVIRAFAKSSGTGQVVGSI